MLCRIFRECGHCSRGPGVKGVGDRADSLETYLDLTAPPAGLEWGFLFSFGIWVNDGCMTVGPLCYEIQGSMRVPEDLDNLSEVSVTPGFKCSR